MNNEFEEMVRRHIPRGAVRTELQSIQVSVGLRCDRGCGHCHVEAGPGRGEIMSPWTMEAVIAVLRRRPAELTLEITGGAPEFHPMLADFLREVRPLVSEIVLNTNLSALLLPEAEPLLPVLKANRVRLRASLPFSSQNTVDLLRGPGAYQECMEALRRLHRLGYGSGSALKIELVRNVAPFAWWGIDDKRLIEVVAKESGVDCDAAVSVVTVAAGRMQRSLDKVGKAWKNAYTAILRQSFDRSRLENLPCMRSITVGWDGRLYDCDYNQGMGMPLEGRGCLRNSGRGADSGGMQQPRLEALREHGRKSYFQIEDYIEDLDLASLIDVPIGFGEHCWACAADPERVEQSDDVRARHATGNGYLKLIRNLRSAVQNGGNL